MDMRITWHAKKRMGERGVAEADIENAVVNCVSSWETAKKSVQYIGPGVDGRMLKVWLVPPGYGGPESSVIVKSVAWRGEVDST